jgi:hypothetical protein
MAPGIKLRATLTICAVECDNLVSYEIIPGLQTRGNRVTHAPVRRGNEWCDGPLILQP